MEEKKIVETLFVRRSVNVSEQDIDDNRMVRNGSGKVSARITGVAELFKKQQLLFIREQD